MALATLPSLSFHPAPLPFRVRASRLALIAAAEAADGTVWALAGGRREECFEAALRKVPSPASAQPTVLLKLSGGAWRLEERFEASLGGLCTDGASLCLIAPDYVLVGEPGRWHRVPLPPNTNSVWSAEGDLYALTGDGFFFRGGTAWKRIRIPLPGRWQQGTGAALDDGLGGSQSFIVGSHSTQSCVARGSRLDWEADSCGAFFLSEVRAWSSTRVAVRGESEVHALTADGFQCVAPAFQKGSPPTYLLGGWPEGYFVGGFAPEAPLRLVAHTRSGRVEVEAQGLGRFRELNGSFPFGDAAFWSLLARHTFPGVALALSKRRLLVGDLRGRAWVSDPLPPELLWKSDGSPDRFAMCPIPDGSFLVDTRQVSNREYDFFLRDTGRPAPAHWRNAAVPKAARDAPVVQVTYSEAAAYAGWARKRLPTNEEWELLARHRNREPTRALRKSGGAASIDGIGLVWEWTSSFYPGRRAKVVRGGKWRDQGGPPRAGNASYEDDRGRDVGFRCVVDAE